MEVWEANLAPFEEAFGQYAACALVPVQPLMC